MSMGAHGQPLLLLRQAPLQVPPFIRHPYKLTKRVLTRVGQNYTYIRIYGVYTVFLAGE
jgi:hypothetical protein